MKINIKNIHLFKDISEDELKKLSSKVNMSIDSFKKGEYIINAGDIVKRVALLIKGEVSIEYYDLWGNKLLLSSLKSGEIFSESYACLHEVPCMVDVVSIEDSEVLFIDIKDLFKSSEYDHISLKLIKNLLEISSKKNVNLSRRIFQNSSKTIRGRVINYLSFEATINHSLEFKIKYNREELSDYLDVDRSALSSELSKMKKDGLIDYRKNYFKILDAKILH